MDPRSLPCIPAQSTYGSSYSHGIPGDPSSKSTQLQGPFHSFGNGLLGPPPSNSGLQSYVGSATHSISQEYDLFNPLFNTFGHRVSDQGFEPCIKNSNSQAYNTLDTGRTQPPASQLYSTSVQQPAPLKLGPPPSPSLVSEPGSYQYREMIVGPWISGQSEQSPEKPWDNNAERRSELATSAKQNEQCLQELKDDNMQLGLELATTIRQLRDDNVQLRSELATTIGQLRDDNVQLRSEVDKRIKDLRQIWKSSEEYLRWMEVCSKSYWQLPQNSERNTTKIRTLEETIERMTQQDGMERNRAQRPTTRIGQKEQHSLRLMEHDEEQETAEQSSHNEKVSKVLPSYGCGWRGCPFKPTNKATNLIKHKMDCHEGEKHSRFLCYRDGCYNSKHPHGFSSQHWLSRHIDQFHLP